ncbi:MAG: HYR domain-containing protein [Saprospiraceae bacterium]|nr:HYR domain-containing protein [Saprospiraceae bacterium]
MEKTVITSLSLLNKKMRWTRPSTLILLIGMFLTLTAVTDLNSQCSLACNGKVQISLDQNCQAVITPGMVINDTMTSCPGATFVVKVLLYKKAIPTSPMVTENEIGKPLQVEITALPSGNKCWGDLIVEDKLPPVITCKSDTVPCFFASKSVPSVVDNCNTILGRNDTLIKLDERIETISCDPNYIKRVVRTWEAKDYYGNKTLPCKDTILLKRFDTSKVICPLDRTLALDNPINCKELVYKRIKLDKNGHPHPDVTGCPLYRDTVSKNPLDIQTIKLWPVLDIYCNVAVTYDDIDLGTIGCVHKIMRMWSIREWWCSSERIRTCIQILEIVDNEAPVLHCPYNIDVTTDGNYKCEATVSIPPVGVFDSCLSTIRVDVEYPGGFLKNSNGGVVKLPVGQNIVTYIAYDHCYNSSSCSLVINVLDKTAPVVVCDRETTVALSLDGIAHVYAKTFDDGSYDDCHIDSFLVRRMSDGPCDRDNLLDPFKPYVEFCCEDVGRNIMVVFRAKDKHGNFNDCMVEVEVQDKIKPICKAPENITIGCDVHVDLNNLNVFGRVVPNTTQPSGYNTIKFWGPAHDTVRLTIHNGYAYDNCALTVDSGFIDLRTQCNTGDIRRFWVVRDNNGFDTCWQNIHIENYHPFDFADLIWPLDSTITNGCPNPSTLTVERFGRPRGLNEDKCDLLGFSYEDQVFHFTNGANACFKLIRTWKAIDWCQFVYNTGTRRYEYQTAVHQQIIKVNNTIDPRIIGSFTDTTFCTLDSCNTGLINLSVNFSDDCTLAADLSWEYLIDLGRDGRFEHSHKGIGGSININGRYPLGRHRVKYVVEDRCGNKVSRERNITILNCKPPTPYCLVGIAVDLMPMDSDGDGRIDTAMICVWASDLDNGSHHPCGNPVTLSFSSDTTDKSRCFTCRDRGQQSVSIWVTDVTTGLQSFCNTFVEIQDNNRACNRNLTSGNVSGLLSFNDKDPLSNAEVTLVGSAEPMQVTSHTGTYAFVDMPFNGAQYTVHANRDDDPLNGVSTADIVRIQKHILGKQYITNPYQIIAADVNKSLSVTSADINELRKLILGVSNRFSNNTSWVFVDKNYKFIETDDAVLTEYKDFAPKDIVINSFNQSFIGNLQGIKVGDVNGSFTGLQNTKTRTNSMLNLIVEEKQFSLNDEIQVPILVARENIISGYQFTIQYNPTQLELLNIVNGECSIGKENSNWTRTNDGLVSISWNATSSGTSNDELKLLSNSAIFTLKFKALSTGQLSKSLEINSTITKAEAYDSQLEEMEIGLSFRNGVQSGDHSFVLYQNQPNPFSEITRIGFDMPKAAKATLSIYDLNSKLVYQQTIQANKGYNNVEINHAQLGVTGVLYYQLDAIGSTETRRMIVIK